MDIKIIGALLVILSCGGFGFAMAAAHRLEEHQLQALSHLLDFLYGQLQYRLMPLPQLCLSAASLGKGSVYSMFDALGKRLEQRTDPDVSACLCSALETVELVPSVRRLVTDLGTTLGLFDLSGQLDSIAQIRSRCHQTQQSLARNREDRLRSYQTLGICAGAALVILLV